jgi:hypothetical protein
MPRKRITASVSEAVAGTEQKCRLHVLPYNDWKNRWAKYYIGFPPNLEITDLRRTWLFKTEEEAKSFARWLDEIIGLLDYFEAKEMLAPHNKPLLEAVKEFAEHIEKEAKDGNHP